MCGACLRFNQLLKEHQEQQKQQKKLEASFCGEINQVATPVEATQEKGKNPSNETLQENNSNEENNSK